MDLKNEENNNTKIETAKGKVKKKNVPLKVGLSIVGIIIVIILLFACVFYIEENKSRPWKSGKVQILGKEIQLPCKISKFESELNTKILFDNSDDEIQKVKLNAGYNETLFFDVYLNGNMVTGIMLKVFRSNEDELYDIDPYETTTKRKTALKMSFPGNVDIETPIDEIKKQYGTKPLNVNYRYFKEEIGMKPPYMLSEDFKYQDDDWSIVIHTLDGEITEISYNYLQNEMI